jgi:hypothetical protein
MDSVDACQTGGSGFVGAELADTTSVPWVLVENSNGCAAD